MRCPFDFLVNSIFRSKRFQVYKVRMLFECPLRIFDIFDYAVCMDFWILVVRDSDNFDIFAVLVSYVFCKMPIPEQ